MKEEDFIRKKCGNRDPFKVPDGYFEQFTSHLMGQLPEEETCTVKPLHPRRAWRLPAIKYAAAAVLCGAVAFGTFQLTARHNANTAMAAGNGSTAESTNAEDVYINDMLDYAMVSNHEIAFYLTEAY